MLVARDVLRCNGSFWYNMSFVIVEYKTYKSTSETGCLMVGLTAVELSEIKIILLCLLFTVRFMPENTLVIH